MKYNAAEMYRVLRRAARVARDRQTTMLQKMQYDPKTHEFRNKSIPIPQSYRSTKRHGQGWAEYDFAFLKKDWKFYSDPRNINQTRAKFREIQSFLQNESSTWEGWNDIVKRTKDKYGEAFGRVMSNQEETEQFYNIYNQVNEFFTREVLESAGVYGKALFDYISEIMEDKDYSDLSPSEISTMIINDIDAVIGSRMSGFDELNALLEEKLEEYNSNHDEKLTMYEFKRGVINGDIEDEDDIYYSARGF